MNAPAVVSRILLKLSGESLGGSRGAGFDPETLKRLAGDIRALADAGVQVAIVVGGGNFFRGMASGLPGCDRVSADHIGMLATVMNALALGHALGDQGVAARVYSAFAVGGIVEGYSPARALASLQRGETVVLGGGTGNPLFTTDTAAALRAVECGCQLLVKATRVDGVYDADPEKNPAATRYTSLRFDEVIARRLAVMDTSAFTLCRDAGLPIRVLDVNRENALLNAARGIDEGTLIS
jgi:uridylate kinase